MPRPLPGKTISKERKGGETSSGVPSAVRTVEALDSRQVSFQEMLLLAPLGTFGARDCTRAILPPPWHAVGGVILTSVPQKSVSTQTAVDESPNGTGRCTPCPNKRRRAPVGLRLLSLRAADGGRLPGGVGGAGGRSDKTQQAGGKDGAGRRAPPGTATHKRGVAGFGSSMSGPGAGRVRDGRIEPADAKGSPEEFGPRPTAAALRSSGTPPGGGTLLVSGNTLPRRPLLHGLHLITIAFSNPASSKQKIPGGGKLSTYDSWSPPISKKKNGNVCFPTGGGGLWKNRKDVFRQAVGRWTWCPF